MKADDQADLEYGSLGDGRPDTELILEAKAGGRSTDLEAGLYLVNLARQVRVLGVPS
jgi:hypothetical protein